MPVLALKIFAGILIVVLGAIGVRHLVAHTPSADPSAGQQLAHTARSETPNVRPLSMSDSPQTAQDSDPSEPALKELFARAADCGDRYRCPPLATLTKLASEPRPASELPAVVRVALAIWADPKTQQSDPQVRIADAVLRSFAESLPARGPDTTQLQKHLGEALAKALDGGSASMRPSIYAFLGSPGAFRLAPAEGLLRSEAERTDRLPDDTTSAARSLAAYDDALDHARRWVLSGTPQSSRAAVALLGGFAAETPQQGMAVRELLTALAHSPQLPAAAASNLLDHLADMKDRKMLSSAEHLQHHADGAVQARATEVASQLRSQK